MEKLKNGWTTSRRIVAPMSLEGCLDTIAGFNAQRLDSCGVLRAHTRLLDSDNGEFTLQTSQVEILGYFKRWEENATLLVLQIRPRPGYVFRRRAWHFVKWATIGIFLLALFALIFWLLDGIDGNFDGMVSTDFSYIGSWNGSMSSSQLEWIPGHEGILLRLMHQHFGDDEFEQRDDGGQGV